MKGFLKGIGVVLIICGILLFIIAGFAQEETKPMQMTTGIWVNGSYQELDSGYIGGNPKANEEMGWMKGVAVVSAILGVGMIIGSASINDKYAEDY